MQGIQLQNKKDFALIDWSIRRVPPQKMTEIGKERKGWQELGREELLQIIREAGIEDQTKRGQTPLGQKGSDPLILDACEAEPYVSSDYALMMSHPVEVLKGAEILRKIYGAERVVIVTQEDKMEAAELLKSKIYFLKWKHFEVEVGEAVYPGDTKPKGARFLFEKRNLAPFEAFAAYEAIALQKPFYERVVTVAGECVIEPRNLWLRIGTTFEDAIKACRGLMRQPAKILRGGPMTGEAVENLDAVVTRDTTAILALPPEAVAKPAEVEPCIRCGRCVEVCPAEISPAMITLAAEHELFDVAREYGAEYCIQCGNCSFICPSKRPMLELIEYAQVH